MKKRSKASIPTDEEILAYDSVPIDVAATYLGKSSTTIRYQLEDAATGDIPPVVYGYAVRNRDGARKWTYIISPGLLVAFKRGTVVFCTADMLPAHA